MKPKPSSPCSSLRAGSLAAALAAVLAGPSAPAATWTGDTDELWNEANGFNWDVLPTSNASLFFGAVGTGGALLLHNNLTDGSFNINGITFDPGAAAFVIGDGTATANSGNAFVLNGNVTNNSTSLETINNPFSVSGTRTITTSGGGGDLTFGGNLSGTGGFLKLGLGTLTLSGANANTGATTVRGGTLKATGDSPVTAYNLALGLEGNSSGAFAYDNVGATGATTPTLGNLNVARTDTTVRLTRTEAQDVALAFNTYSAGANENGRTLNVVVDGPGVVNGTNARVVLVQQTGFKLNFINAVYFNGSDFAVYDDGPDDLYYGLDTLNNADDDFVRAIDYINDPNSATSAGTPFMNTTNQEVTASIIDQPTVKLGSNSGGNENGTLKIVGASDITLLAGANLTIDSTNDQGTKGIIKTGGGKSVISGGSFVTQTQKNQMIRVDGPTDVLEFAMQYNINSGARSRFMKSGKGTLIFSGTSLTPGTIAAWWINDGVVEMGGDITFTMASGIKFANNALFKYDSTSATSSITSGLSGEGSLVVSAGMLTLDGNDTYKGTTEVTGGTLVRNGTSTGTGALTVSSGGRLGGNGSTNADVTVASGGRLLVDISDWTGVAGSGFTQLDVNSLDLTGGPWTLDVGSGTSFASFTGAAATFRFLTSGGITGFSAGSVSVVPDGSFTGTGTWSVRQTGDDLELVYTPGAGGIAPVITSIAVTGTTATITMTGKPVTTYVCKSSLDLVGGAGGFTAITTSPATVITNGSGNATFTVDATEATKFFLVAP